jgi:TPR repeat protein
MTNLDESMQSGEESAESKAFKRYLLFAERNDVASQLKVADMFSTGEGVEKNEENAIAWYKKAAASENVEAMQKLAQIYERNLNEEVNYWWIKLAETGDAFAEYKTALLYLKNSNVKKHAQGVLLLKQAAEKKFTKAEYFLGVLFIEGKRVKKSTEMGCLLLKQAAEKNFVLAQRRLGIELFERDEKDCSSKEAFYWLSEGAKNDDGLCFYFLGHCFLLGKGTHKSEKDAFYCFEKAASKNIAEAQHALACCYSNGLGAQKNTEKCLELLLISSKNGNISAKYKVAEIILHEIFPVPSHLNKDHAFDLLRELTKINHIEGSLLYARACEDDNLSFQLYKQLASQKITEAYGPLAYRYEKGLGVKKCEKNANFWRRLSLKFGDPENQFSYSERLYYGLFCKKNKKESFKWCLEAGKNNYEKAFCALGRKYHFGDGIKRDVAKAIKWYTKAAESGNTDAMYILGVFRLEGYGNKKKEDRSKKHFTAFRKSGERMALEWLTKAAEQGHTSAKNHVAWILATSYDPLIRNGEEAEKWAKKAIATKGEINARWVDTLAAAYAEQGKFEAALATQTQAISILKKRDVKQRKEFKRHLKLYTQGKPWRESVKTALA